jgi:hypothetical protein
MLGLRSMIATLGVGTLSLFSSPAAGAATPAGLGATVDLAVSTAGETEVTFSTLPDARCSLSTAGAAGGLVVYADDRGVVRLHANPAKNISVTALIASCQNGGRQATTTLRFHPVAHAVAAPAVRRSAPLQALLPANLNAATLSDAQIKQLGLPPRPDAAVGSKAYAQWLRAMTTPVERLAPTTILRSDVIHGPARNVQAGRRRLAGAVQQSVFNSNNWSGIVETGSTGQFNYAVEGEWYVPRVSTTPGASPADSSLWEGIDGWGSGDVIQNGTEQDAFYFPFFGSLSSYYAWYEFYPDNGSTQFANFSVSPGDEIYSESWLCYNSSGQRFGCYFIEDLTKGEVSPVKYELGSQPALFRGNAAEWVFERPTVGGSLHALPNYGSAYMTDEFAWDTHAGGWRAYTSENYAAVYMYNSGSDLLSWGYPYNSDSSYFFWSNYL